MVKISCPCGFQRPTVLPFNDNPPLTAYNYNAFVSGILHSSSGRYENIFANDYIQMSSPAVYSRKHLLAFLPALGLENLAGTGAGLAKVRAAGKAAEIAETISRGVLSGHYCRIVLDEHFVPDRQVYRRRHHTHDNLIFGYCSYCQNCWIAGYRVSEERPTPYFGVSICPLPSVCDGILSRHNGETPAYLQDVIVLFRPLPPPLIRPEHIKRQFTQFLESRLDTTGFLDAGYDPLAVRSPTGSEAPIVYGLAIYDQINDHIIDNIGSKSGLDLRAFRLLWEHKYLMVQRCILLRKLIRPQGMVELEQALKMSEKRANKIRYRAMGLQLPSERRKFGVFGTLSRYMERKKAIRQLTQEIGRLKEDDERHIASLAEAL